MANLSPDVLAAKFEASLVLSAVGDAIGYKGGSWEFSKSGSAIHAEAASLGGVEKIVVEGSNWRVSDDTVMHLATAEALIEWNPADGLDKLYPIICKHYVRCWDDMDGRAPGIQCGKAMPYLKRGHWDSVPFSNSGGGCGAAMRTMCIGLIFNKPSQLEQLVAVAIESGRMTHNHPTGFLGGVVAALFTAYALPGVPVHQWGQKMVDEALPVCMKYLSDTGRFWDEYVNNNALSYFEQKWTEYLTLRKIRDGKTLPQFPAKYGVEERDEFYKRISFSGWGGSSGHDSVIIAYDALLGCNGDWIEFLKRGALHGGDSDSTGAIGAAWFGVLYGYNGVPNNHYKGLEYLKRIKEDAAKLVKVCQLVAGR